MTHYFAKLLNDKALLKSYITVNIENLEEDFLPSDKVLRAYGAVNMATGETHSRQRKLTAPQCTKCGSLENPEKYCQYLRQGKVFRCKEETKIAARPMDLGGLRQKANAKGTKTMDAQGIERHSQLKQDP